jgi:peptide methionine sulfoxide reductase MsrB
VRGQLRQLVASEGQQDEGQRYCINATALQLDADRFALAPSSGASGSSQSNTRR